jgi:fructose-1,6-bisphosphatase I
MDHAADTYRTDLMTITRYVLNEQSKNPESRGDLTILLSHIVLGCKFVASAVNKAGLAKLTGLAGETNVQASCHAMPISSSFPTFRPAILRRR